MTKPCRRQQVLSLLVDIRHAARRPLFTEIALFEKTVERRRKEKSRQEVVLANCSTVEHSARNLLSDQELAEETLHQTWEELLNQSSLFAPFMTEQEHAEVLQLASIFLLGFLLPYSTGNEWFLLQQAPEAYLPHFDPVDYVLTMPLEDRLSKSIRRYAANEYGEINTLADKSVEIAMDSFLFNGLAPLLSARQLSRDKVDLLHVMALGICPLGSSPKLPLTTIQRLDQQKHPCWLRTKKLMKDFLTASQFRLSYGTRLKLIRVVIDNVNSPCPLDEASSDVVAPLLFGAVPHLRSALNDFAEDWALCDADADMALAAEAKLSQCNERTLIEDWDFLLHKLCEGATCRCTGSVEHCPFMRQKALLSSFFACHLCRPRISRHVGSSLADAVEWQLDIWTQNDKTGVDDDETSAVSASNGAMDAESGSVTKPNRIPCLIAALLSSATEWFRDGSKGQQYTADENHEPSSTLIQASIQLVQHFEKNVAVAAAQLLVAALQAYPLDVTLPQKLFNSTMTILSRKTADCLFLKDLLGMAARRSRPFAFSVLDALLHHATDLAADDNWIGAFLSLIASVSMNSPAIASKQADKLIELARRADTLVGAVDVMVSLSSHRQARCFAAAATDTDFAVARFVAEKRVNQWTVYRMARHAMLSGNFAVASDLFRQLLSGQMTEKNFLWVLALQEISSAELVLSQKASKGIPEAICGLRSALSRFVTLERTYRSSTESFLVQISLLSARIDFLDLLTIIRQLTWEMRLSGSIGTKYTRTHCHRVNAAAGLVRLAKRYRGLLRDYGTRVTNVQSTVALRLLEFSCMFLANGAQRAFLDTVRKEKEEKECSFKEVSELPVPMATLIQKLDAIVDSLDSSVDYVVRAHALLEVLDGLLMVPVPIPLILFAPFPRLRVEVMLSADPCDNESGGDLKAIETSPSLSFTFICSGHIPTGFLSRMSSTLLLWYKISYVGPVEDDDAVPLADDGHDFEVDEAVPREFILGRIPDPGPYLPATGMILSAGRFCIPILCPPLQDEGLFRIDVTVGCRDNALNEWRLPTSTESSFINVRVLRCH